MPPGTRDPSERLVTPVAPGAPAQPSCPTVERASGAALATSLLEEAADLGRRLGHPVLALTGAAGVLNPAARPVVRVFDVVDQEALVAQVEELPHRSQLFVLEGVTVDTARLERRGWRLEPGWVTDCSAPVDLPWPCTGDVLRVTEDDLPAVRSVLDQAFQDDRSGDFLPSGVTGSPGLQLLLQRADGRPVGTIGVRLRPDGALVFGLGVLPDARRQGHALALVGAAAQQARAQGCRTLHVQSEESALGFWTAAGFVARTRWRSFTPPP